MRGAVRPILTVIPLVALLAGGVFFWSEWAGDDEDGSGRPLVTAVAELRTLQRTIAVRGIASYAVTGKVIALAPGRVTAVSIATGSTVEAGQPLVSVDGRPMIAVAGSTPFWRSLSQGDSGPDVLELERLLDAAGYSPGIIDGTFTGSTRLALEEWQEAFAFPADGVFWPSDMMPGHWPARVGTVSVAVGDFVAPGQQLATLTGDELTVTVSLAATQRLRVEPGLLVELELTGNRAPGRGTLGEPREVAPSTLPGADQTTTYEAPVVIDGEFTAIDGAQVQASIILAEVPDAVVVPLAAIVMDGSGASAVQVQTPTGVQIVPVTTGLAEGAFVEVRTGLSGGETVLLEQR